MTDTPAMDPTDLSQLAGTLTAISAHHAIALTEPQLDALAHAIATHLPQPILTATRGIDLTLEQAISLTAGTLNTTRPLPDLATARDTLATATALGMPVPAIPGSTYHLAIFRKNSGTLAKPEPHTSATTRDGALTRLLQLTARQRATFHDKTPTPWAGSTDPRTITDQITTWIDQRTPEQATLDLYGPEINGRPENRDNRWTTREYTITG